MEVRYKIKISSRNLLLSLFVAIGMILWSSSIIAAAAEKSAILSSIDFKTINSKKVQAILQLTNPVKNMRSFSTKAPARVVLDLFDVKDGIHKTQESIDKGVLHQVTSVQAGDRTRIMLDLNGVASYRTSVVGNKIYVTLTERTPVVYKKKSSYSFTPNAWSKTKHRINGIDFHRGDAGGGEIVVSLSDASMGINVNQDAGKIIVDFLDASAKSLLLRRLDVTDFGTPVQFIQTSLHGANVKMVITPNGKYQHLAYQINDKFVIDVNPIKETDKSRANAKDEQPQYSGERLSLNFQDIQVRAVLQILAEFTGLNIVASDSVTGNVTLRLNNVPWDEALAIILRTQGLTQRKVGSVLMIAPAQEVAAREQEELESQQKVEALEPLQTAFITLNYAKAAEVADLLKNEENTVISERGNVSVDARTNSVLLKDTPEMISVVRDLVKKLDVPVRQVLIEARIVNINSTFERSFGIAWGMTKPDHVSGSLDGANTIQNNIRDGVDALTDVPVNSRLNVLFPATSNSGANPATFGVALAKLGKGYLLDLELQAVETEGGGEVISTPRLVTADQQEAFIESGEEIPYQESSANGATTVAFRDAVLRLLVTPQITPDNNIIMVIKVNQDKRSNEPEVLGVPAIDTKQIETKVLVNNGQTLVLGGIYEQEQAHTSNRIPFLGDLPIIGNLFRSTNKQDERTELLIFITPKIVEHNSYT